MTMKCDNCGETFQHRFSGLVVHQEGSIAAAICNECVVNVEVAKIVLRRNGERFVYEQFLPAAAVKQTG
jgi:hypothetical protein